MTSSDEAFADQRNDTVDALRADIAATRAEVAATVDQLSAKLDVNARARQQLQKAKASVSQNVDKARAAAPAPVQTAIDRARPHAREIAVTGVAMLVLLMVIKRWRS